MIEARGHWVPCGQCIQCRINKKREWAGRILLETKYTARPSCFLTLTYNDEYLPHPPTINTDEPREFINNLRFHHRKAYGENLRFFTVGEYGDKMGRPHYHMALFGSDPAVWEAEYQKQWQKGFIKAGEITPASALYIAHYTTKKMLKDEHSQQHFHLLPWAMPEYARMSRRPPIGAPGAIHLLKILQTKTGQKAIKEGGVPRSFEHEGKQWPIGRYWWRWLHKQLKLEIPSTVDLGMYTDMPMQPAQKVKDNAAKKKVYQDRQAINHTRASRSL